MTNKNFNQDLGLNFIGFINKMYVIELVVEPRHHNAGGFVHGGVIATILDTAMARAYWKQQSPDKMSSVTLEMKVNYLRPIKQGKLIAKGKLVNTTRRTAYVEGHVEDESGRLLAKASATLMLTES